ncbi:hypothetical protein ACFYRY_15925 [Streptomyces sp. NPDC005263]|uniref:hypothetical protein n=1 Tax=Streptomyces sp. NPDC005263 TaxID=3364711 RepID=UPI0036B804DD
MRDDSHPSYPVVSSRPLEPPVARGWRAIGSPRREPSDLPRLGTHQVAVYRVGEMWVENHGSLDLRSDTAVSATSVTVVDKRRNVPVEAMVTVPSADSSDFAVRVRFRCTVDDSVALVREGPADAVSALTSYLHACPGLVEEGLDHGVAQVTEVRKWLSARVSAFSVTHPPRLPGMTAELVSVDVLTPSELREFQAKLEELERRRRQDEVEQAVEQDRKVREREYQNQLELLDKQHQEELQRRELDVRLQLEEQQAAYEREQEELDAGQTAKLGSRWALLRAYRRKELTAEQLAERLGVAEREAREAAERRDETERALVERLSTLWREDLVRDTERADRRWELRWQEKTRMLNARREELLTKGQEEREDRLRREQHQREDSLRRERDERTRGDRQQEMYYELYKQLIREGYTDMTPVDIRALLDRIIGANLDPGAQSPDKQLESVPPHGEAQPPTAPDAPGDGTRADRTTEDGEDDAAFGEDDESDTFDIGDVGREEHGY